MPKFFFDYEEGLTTRRSDEPIELAGLAVASELALQAAHEAGLDLARRQPSGEIVVVVSSQDRLELARAKISWSVELSSSGQATGVFADDILQVG